MAIQLSTLVLNSEPEIVKLLTKELPKKNKDVAKEWKRLQLLMAKVEQIRKKTYKEAKDLIFTTTADVALKSTEEVSKEVRAALGDAAREERKARFSRELNKEQLDAILNSQGVDGKSIEEWFHSWEQGDLQRIAQVVKQASVEEMTVAQISKVVGGTKANNYTDGILGTTRAGAILLARTLINGVSNNTRVETIKENSDIIDGVQFVGTLDGKTCPYCASYDGKIWRGDDMGSARRPPVHPNCRCCLIPKIDLKDKDGKTINIDETRPAAEADFDALAQKAYDKEAQEKGLKRRFADLAPSTRLKYYYKAQKDYEAQHGKPAYRQVSQDLTFKDYFKSQPDSFKRSWLGAKRFALYESGKLTDDEIFKPNLGFTATIGDLNVSTNKEIQEDLLHIQELSKREVVKSSITTDTQSNSGKIKVIIRDIKTADEAISAIEEQRALEIEDEILREKKNNEEREYARKLNRIQVIDLKEYDEIEKKKDKAKQDYRYGFISVDEANAIIDEYNTLIREATSLNDDVSRIKNKESI